MNEFNFNFNPGTDLDILDKIMYYLDTLRSVLPFPRLVDHCSGAFASIFELYFYLKSKNLDDYGNNKK